MGGALRAPEAARRAGLGPARRARSYRHIRMAIRPLRAGAF
ncbi:hypothetical protein C7S16_5313 [Burkholderia thailandensis]|uniref:Uncharacterized protein n=1 Tax=Burkholderia thailandensis TaxID=57975 RepID=A0AAW9CSQ4_BURTH|nr:hypothetical protein [Burkholderia thailandensis]